MQDYFFALADAFALFTRGDEVSLANFAAEDSDFVRLNKSAVRQAGSVEQRALSIDLIHGGKHCGGTLTLSGDLDADREHLRAAIARYRERLALVPADPHLLYATEVQSTQQSGANRLPADRATAINALIDAGRGADLVGIYAAGGIYRGFANSLGQRNWYASHTFNADWSFYLAGDKAVKTGYAGFEWNAADFARKVDTARAELAALSRPPRTISPGRYRAYLAPAALSEILGMLTWGGFGLKSQRTKHTPLLRMLEQGAALSERVTLSENTREGVAANFQTAGYVKPDGVTLIERGRLADCLVSPRSAKEYGVATNGAADSEAPESLDLAAGDLALNDVLKRLDTGVYVNNLWYLNYSDRAAGRITGMTRFATFWVERGEIVAPLNVMRFDDTVYTLLGNALEALTDERDFILDAGTYGARSTGSVRAPGALLSALTFTL
ncbi:MAG: TldE/PmbA family protein [Betaproteobacteria bacterium]|nr:TldE/PmbA family protein [Betaproteobacteria bacterium]